MSTNGLRLREARAADCGLLHVWANDALTRSMSFDSAPIPLETHEAWFAGRLADPLCLYFVFESPEGGPVAQVRLERDAEGDDPVISVSVAFEARGRGYATEAIRAACEAARGLGIGAPIRAYIKQENAASVRAFERAGFVDAVPLHYRDQPALLLTCK